MRRLGSLMPRICTWQNIMLAWNLAAIGKRRAVDVQRFGANLECELNTLVRQLAAGVWQPGPYRRFVVRDPKVRTIHAAPFRDRVVHHALMNVAGAGFERGAIEHSYACRIGRGNRAAIRHAAACTRRYRFCLKLDIRRYFDSIRHETLRAQFQRRFKDGAFLALLDRVIESFHVSPGRGLPIGTLTSQYFANFHLDGLDHWITETLRCPGYVRYMDDFILWHDEESVLAGWLDAIRGWLTAERRLEVKGKPRPVPCLDGVPFLGYRITPRRVLLGRAARRRFRRRLRGYEMAQAAGEIDSRELQRRVDALLAFVRVAECRAWRRRVLATLPSASGM